MLKIAIIFISLVLNAQILAQTTGKVYDLITGEPLIGVMISNNAGEIVSITDPEGLFIFSETEGVFKVSVMGYRDTSVVIERQGKQEWHRIGLSPQAYDLPEVRVIDHAWESRTFDIRERRLRPFALRYRPYKIYGNIKRGTSFRNSYHGKITSLSIYFSDAGNTDEFQFLRLRILEMNDEGKPGMDLLRETVLLEPEDKGWYTVDLKDFDIPLTGREFLVAVEFIFRKFSKEDMPEDIDEGRSKDLPLITLTRLPRSERAHYAHWAATNYSPWWKVDSNRDVLLFRVEALVGPQD